MNVGRPSETASAVAAGADAAYKRPPPVVAATAGRGHAVSNDGTVARPVAETCLAVGEGRPSAEGVHTVVVDAAAALSEMANGVARLASMATGDREPAADPAPAEAHGEVHAAVRPKDATRAAWRPTTVAVVADRVGRGVAVAAWVLVTAIADAARHVGLLLSGRVLASVANVATSEFRRPRPPVDVGVAGTRPDAGRGAPLVVEAAEEAPVATETAEEAAEQDSREKRSLFGGQDGHQKRTKIKAHCTFSFLWVAYSFF